MKKIIITLFILLICLSAITQTPSVKEFSFLLGNWELKTKNGKTTEHWKSNAKTYAGSSYKHHTKGDSTLTETIILKQINGVWHYCVTGYEKNNEGTTNFKLISSKNNTYIFENPAHDFPQRITYQPKGKNNLLAWIEGKMNGKDLKIEFPYQR